MIDLPQVTALIGCAVDIKTVRIPQLRAAHSIGEAIELAVADMLVAVADCLDRAATLLKESGEHDETAEYVSNLVRRTLSEIADCHAEAEGWRLAHAMVKAARSTKH